MLRASGQAGEVRHRYQVAARTGLWSIEPVQVPGRRRPDRYRFAAPLLEADEVWLAHTPLDLVLAIGPAQWIWRDVAPELGADGQLTVILDRRPDVVGPRPLDDD